MESGKEMKNQRMLDELTELMRIDVSSGQETEIAEHLVKKLEQMGFAITRDEAGATFGGVCGNILAVREGERDGVVCFCSHMDRVPGGIGIKPVEEDGILRSSSDTILAADDLSGVAAILEGVRQAIESGKALPKLEILFTVGEEAGLYGAKAFDVSLLTSKTMYVLDSPGRIGRIVMVRRAVPFWKHRFSARQPMREMSRRKALMRQKLWRKCSQRWRREDWMKIQRRTFLTSGPKHARQ